MTCQEFLDRYSEYRDAEEGDPVRDPFLRHLEECAGCSRYESVVRQGVEYLRSTPGLGPREDFRDRLRHRIYQSELEDGRSGRGGGASGFVTVALAAAAVITGMAIWGPISLVTPSVSLPGVQARAPQGAAVTPSLPAGAVRGERAPAFLFQEDLWSQSHVLLYEFSPLYHRTREGALVRTGLQ